MELLILLIIALIILAWRINSKMRKHSSVDDSYNDWVDDSPYDDDRSRRSDDDIYTDPFYCYLREGDIIGLFFDDDDRSSIFDDHWSCSIWDDIWDD